MSINAPKDAIGTECPCNEQLFDKFGKLILKLKNKSKVKNRILLRQKQNVLYRIIYKTCHIYLENGIYLIFLKWSHLRRFKIILFYQVI